MNKRFSPRLSSVSAKTSLLFFTVVALGLRAAEQVPPNLSVNGWVPGVGVGPVGTSAAYRPARADQLGLPGQSAAGISARTVELDLIATYSADPTGVTSVHTAIEAAKADAIGAGKVIKFGTGVFRTTSQSTIHYLGGYTYRGSGSGVRSTSTHTIGPGVKTFTVPAGLNWVVGRACWVNIRSTETASNEHRYMWGLITAYTGTSLSIDFANFDTRSGATATAGTDVVTSTQHGLATGDTLNISSLTGGGGLATSTTYWVIRTGENTLKLASSAVNAQAGTAIDITSDASVMTLQFHVGTTSSDWMVGQTTILRDMSSGAPFGSAGYGVSEGNGTVAIVGDYAAGATEITVASGTALADGVAINARMVAVDTHNPAGSWTSKGYQRINRQLNRVASVVGNVVTLEVPLLFALQGADSPRIVGPNFQTTRVGIEDMQIVDTLAQQNSAELVALSGMYECWLYNLRLGPAYKCLIETSELVRCEIDHVAASYSHPDAQGLGVVRGGYGTANLYRHFAFSGNQRNAWYGGGEIGSAWLWGWADDADFNLNHSYMPRYLLFEGNRVRRVFFDSFHGPGRDSAFFRNDLRGSFSLNQFSWYCSGWGNTIGRPGVDAGAVSLGYPYNGNTNNDHADPVNGSLMHLFDLYGRTRVTGVVASSVPGVSITVTLTNGMTVEDDLNNHHWTLSGGDASYDSISALWGADAEENGPAALTLLMDRTNSSGTTVICLVQGLTNFVGGATDFPANGTAIRLHPFRVAPMEIDDSVAGTGSFRHNALAQNPGSGWTIASALSGGDTMPLTLAGSVPTNVTVVNPDSPSTDLAEIPAGNYVLNGVWPDEAGNVVAAPVLSPWGGAVPQTVTLTCSTSGATIYYTIDGSTPTASSAVYSAPVSMTAAGVLKAFATKSGMADSSIATGIYTSGGGGGGAANATVNQLYIETLVVP